MYAHSIAAGRDPESKLTLKSTKLDAVIDYVIEHPGPKVLITNFTSSLIYLYQRLGSVRAIYGEDDGPDYRRITIAEFNAGHFDNLICNEDTVKMGLNLSKASLIILCENSFKGASRIQVEERCTVKGKEAVEIIDFCTIGDCMAGMIDDYVLSAVRSKKDFNYKMLSGRKL
jgi:hypothetical protein